jgi:predicted metal-dependent hydrolase
MRKVESSLHYNMPEITINNTVVPYSIYRRKGNKHVRLSVTHKGDVRISVPWRYPARFIPGVFRQHAAWLLNKIQDSHKRLPRGPKYHDGTRILFRGNTYRLVFQYHGASNAGIRLIGEEARLTLPDGYKEKRNIDGIDAFMAGWYRHHAEAYIPGRVAALAEPMNLQYNAVRLKDLRSRWGSCSVEKNLNFNIRLMCLAPEIIDYVIIHELSHLIELNHSAEFWKIVARYCPEYKRLRKDLRNEGKLLID